MTIEIRDVVEEELSLLWDIRTNPLVLQTNYPPRPSEGIENWKILLYGKPVKKMYRFNLTVILCNDKLAGYVSQYHHSVGGEKNCLCGWDLAPEYWGRGIMPNALRQLFERLFTEEQVAKVVAECFPDNKRCLRVMEKLGFVETNVPLLEKLVVAISLRKYYKTLRFKLNYLDWKDSMQ